MLTPISQLYGMPMSATDGELGRIQDLYFDDLNWTVRFLVVDTAGWLPGRKVLVSPYSVQPGSLSSKSVSVNLTRRQIEQAPSIDTHKPVSRQYEEAFYKYHGLPQYWQGTSVWGMSGSPIVELPSGEPLENGPGEPVYPRRAGDPHLRSTQAVKGYHFQTGDEIVGQVVDFIMNRSTWTLEQLVIRRGNRFTGVESVIPMSSVTRISYPDSTVTGVLNAQEMGHRRDEPPIEFPGESPLIPALGIT